MWWNLKHVLRVLLWMTVYFLVFVLRMKSNEAGGLVVVNRGVSLVMRRFVFLASFFFSSLLLLQSLGGSRFYCFGNAVKIVFTKPRFGNNRLVFYYLEFFLPTLNIIFCTIYGANVNTIFSAQEKPMAGSKRKRLVLYLGLFS